MTNSPEGGCSRDVSEVFRSRTLRIALGGAASIVATFTVAVSAAGLVQTLAVLVIIVTFLTLVILPYERRMPGSSDEIAIDRVLGALDLATYFARSLTPADALRLIAGQVGAVVPVKGLALHVVERSGEVKTAAAVGTEEDENRPDNGDSIREVVDRCLAGGEVWCNLSGAGHRQDTVGVPLRRNGEVFAVVAIEIDAARSGGPIVSGGVRRVLFESIGSRITPLILSSLSFERGRATAMTDAMTDLPNERAFFLILENQVAETQRNSEARPLSVLAIDIKDFEAMSQKYGHAASDQALQFVGRVVREDLRQMDFFTRSRGSEFLAVLPTAANGMSQEIADRIHAALMGRDLEVAEGRRVKVELNIGCATFGLDGETAPQLLSIARARRDQADSYEPARILRFPGYEARV